MTSIGRTLERAAKTETNPQPKKESGNLDRGNGGRVTVAALSQEGKHPKTEGSKRLKQLSP